MDVQADAALRAGGVLRPSAAAVRSRVNDGFIRETGRATVVSDENPARLLTLLDGPLVLGELAAWITRPEET